MLRGESNAREVAVEHVAVVEVCQGRGDLHSAGQQAPQGRAARGQHPVRTALRVPQVARVNGALRQPEGH